MCIEREKKARNVNKGMWVTTRPCVVCSSKIGNKNSPMDIQKKTLHPAANPFPGWS